MNDYLNTVETKKITKRFGDFTAVDNVDFYIQKGEIFGLLGPNGAGKTTLMRMLCGIMLPSGGTAKVLGWDVRENPEKIKRNIGYISQRFSLYNDLTSYENISFYSEIYDVPNGKRKSRIEELIQITGLAGLEDIQAKQLSGAWRQRLALACAITHRPPMLFLDEATAGVDPISRREFWDLIYEMAGEGVSVLATTHYMDEAEYCNKVGMILDGKIISIASPDTFKESLEGFLVVVDCDDPIRAEEVLDGLDGVLDASIHGILLHVMLKSENMVCNVKRALIEEGILIENIELIQPSLEDVFINIVEAQRKIEKENFADGVEL